MLLVFIGLGLLFVLLSMIFVVNPPEAWIKRVFLRDRGQGAPASREKED